MDRSLDSLKPEFRVKVFEFLARLTEASIPVLIVQTSRTPEEHAANLANGTSWTQHSKHLDGLAIDIVPFSQYLLNGPDKLQWDINDPVWVKIGAIGKSLGLRWGGDFKLPAKPDLGHFEYVGK